MPYDKDIVIYVTPESKKFFEIGRNVSYQLNPERNKYRYELIALLKKTFALTNNEWIKASDYNRWIDFPENFVGLIGSYYGGKIGESLLK